MKRLLRSEILLTLAVAGYGAYLPYFAWKLSLMAVVAASYAVSRSTFKHGRGPTHTSWIATELYVVLATLVYGAVNGLAHAERAMDALTCVSVCAVLYNLGRGLAEKLVVRHQAYL